MKKIRMKIVTKHIADGYGQGDDDDDDDTLTRRGEKGNSKRKPKEITMKTTMRARRAPRRAPDSEKGPKRVRKITSAVVEKANAPSGGETPATATATVLSSLTTNSSESYHKGLSGQSVNPRKHERFQYEHK
jgi:hypothetical protein